MLLILGSHCLGELVMSSLQAFVSLVLVTFRRITCAPKDGGLAAVCGTGQTQNPSCVLMTTFRLRVLSQLLSHVTTPSLELHFQISNGLVPGTVLAHTFDESCDDFAACVRVTGFDGRGEGIVCRVRALFPLGCVARPCVMRVHKSIVLAGRR